MEAMLIAVAISLVALYAISEHVFRKYAAIQLAKLKQGERFMASVQEVTDSLTALGTQVSALTAAFQAKAAGIDPAALDPIKTSMDGLAQNIVAVLNPPPAA